ncbi:MAG: hypothetical protein KKE73_09605 [Proteobacteria bacterium]|nr:hypothetical protein [Pseudomonadota bacterium]
MEWKTIPGFPAYEINKRGRIRKADTRYVLSPKGAKVQLWSAGVAFSFTVADLIAQAFAEEDWRPVSHLPGHEINRQGDVRRIKDQVLLKHNQGGFHKVPYVQGQTPDGPKAGTINVLLEEAFGEGAAEAAGFPRPDLSRVERGRAARQRGKRDTKPKRVCHDCGRPTDNYRCSHCWKVIRGESETSISPMDPEFI